MNTLPRGINRRIHGSFHALAEQAKERTYTAADAKRDMKWLATSEGYPLVTKRIKFKGKVVEWKEPASLSGQPDAVAMILMNTIQVFADERELYLYEYDDDDQPYRTVGGRSKTEMLQFIHDVEEKGEIEKARRLRAPIKGKELQAKRTAEEIINDIF